MANMIVVWVSNNVVLFVVICAVLFIGFIIAPAFSVMDK